jgi:cell division protein FtsQ
MIARLQPEFAAMDARIDMLELSGRGSWRVELDTGAEIELGRGSEGEVIARTRTFIATLPEVRNRYAQHPLLYADLRHNDGYAVRLKGVSTAVEAAKKK